MKNTDVQEIELSDTIVEELFGKKLVVYNDDVNSFEHVIECLVKYLEQTHEQAEQCAFIIHSKGQYAVKGGTFEELEPYKTALDDAGLSTEIF